MTALAQPAKHGSIVFDHIAYRVNFWQAATNGRLSPAGGPADPNTQEGNGSVARRPSWWTFADLASESHRLRFRAQAGLCPADSPQSQPEVSEPAEH